MDPHIISSHPHCQAKLRLNDPRFARLASSVNRLAALLRSNPTACDTMTSGYQRSLPPPLYGRMVSLKAFTEMFARVTSQLFSDTAGSTLSDEAYQDYAGRLRVKVNPHDPELRATKVGCLDQVVAKIKSEFQARHDVMVCYDPEWCSGVGKLTGLLNGLIAGSEALVSHAEAHLESAGMASDWVFPEGVATDHFPQGMQADLGNDQAWFNTTDFLFHNAASIQHLSDQHVPRWFA